MKNLNKYINVFVLTGLGQFLAIWFVSYITSEYSNDIVKSIARFDTAFIISLGFCSLGIGQYFPRYLINDETFKESLNDARIIRLLSSFFLFFIGILMLVIGQKEYAIAFLFSPLLFIGVDFALYVRGKQVSAAVCTFLRVSGTYFIVFMSLFLFLSDSDGIYIIYLYISLFIVLSISASIVSIKILDVPLLPKFKIPNKQVILGVIQLGGAFFLYSSCKTLIIPIADFYFTTSQMVEIFVFFKMYLLVFSIRRVYVQVSHQWLDNKRKSNILNGIYFIGTSIFTIFYLTLYYIWDLELFSLVLNIQIDNNILMLILIFILSIFTVYPTRLLMLNGDGYYKRILVSLSLLFLLTIPLFSNFLNVKYLISLVILFEFLVGLFCFFSVLKIEKKVKNLNDTLSNLGS